MWFRLNLGTRPPPVLHLPGLVNPDRRSVVAVPGLGLSVQVPARTLRQLQPVMGSTVVALPGYGVPPEPEATVDPAALAARLLGELDTLHVTKVVLLGHSASCQIVVEAAIRDPSRVVAAILIGPTTDPRAARWPALAFRWIRTAVWERPWQAPILARDYRYTGLLAMARAMEAARRHRIDQAMEGLPCPVLVVRGRHDRIAPARWAATLAAQASRGRAVTLPAGAHMVPITHPAPLAAEILTFLSSLR